MEINKGDAVAFRPAGSAVRVIGLVLAVAIQAPPSEGAAAPDPLLDIVYVVPREGDVRGEAKEANGVMRASQLAASGWEHLGLLGQGAEQQPADVANAALGLGVGNRGVQDVGDDD